MVDQTPQGIKDAINQTLELMKSGNLPDAIALVLFPVNNRPFSTWSLFNRLNVMYDFQAEYQGKYFEGEKFNYEKYKEAFEKIDYRGFRMWEKVGRSVKKGQHAHAFILAPISKKGFRKYWVNETGSKHPVNKLNPAPEGSKILEEQYNFIKGFRAVPVFEASQTLGKPIKFHKLELPKLQYKEVADFLKIKVSAVEGNKDYYGAFSPTHGTIQLATPEASVFFHELSHAVDNYIGIKSGRGALKGGQQVDQEIVAEFSAAVLARIVGIKIEQTAANMKRYVENYAGKEKSEQEIIKVISRIEAVLDFITNFKDEKSVEVQAKEHSGKSENISVAEKLADTPDPRTVVAATDSYAKGGVVKKTGLALVHKGEVVIPTKKVKKKTISAAVEASNRRNWDKRYEDEFEGESKLEELQKLSMSPDDNEERINEILEELEDEYHVDLTDFYGEDFDTRRIGYLRNRLQGKEDTA